MESKLYSKTEQISCNRTEAFEKHSCFALADELKLDFLSVETQLFR